LYSVYGGNKILRVASLHGVMGNYYSF